MESETKMNKIIKISEEIDEEKLSLAEEYHKEVIARTIITANNLLELGRLFKTIRDDKLYKLLGADSFSEYIAYPEISFGRSTIYSFIGIYELYVLKLNYHPTFLSKIGHRALQIITPPMKEFEREGMEAGEWMEKAGTLSESDLINEVRKWQGKPEMMPKPMEIENVYPFSFQDYITFVRNAPCIICGNTPSDPAHFPRTRGAGARDEDVMPLCRDCHTLQGRDTFDFLWLHKDKIFKYFYDTFLRAYEIIRKNEL